MKRRLDFFWSFVSILCFALVACPVQADWGPWDQQDWGGVFLDINGVGTEYFTGAQFHGRHLADLGTGDSLLLKGADLRTWENGGSEVTNVTFHYRLHAEGQPPGEFILVNIPFAGNLENPGDKLWKEDGLEIDLLEGLTLPVRYRVEFYISFNGSNPAGTKWFSADGRNFAASFSYNETRLLVNGVNANYTTSKFFIDERAGESYPLDIVFLPNVEDPVSQVEVFSNLNRRDYATLVWTNAEGIVTHEGIQPRPGHFIEAGMTNHYYMAWPMISEEPGKKYTLTLLAEKTGAYRLSVRYKTEGNTNWHWYTDRELGRRDHAVVVSPSDALEMVMYELNIFNIKATGATGQQRSTFVDLWEGPGADPGRPGWNLDYARDLGVNWLWFQPVHPYGVDGRHLSAADITNRAGGGNETTWLWNDGDPYEDVDYPYALGSPYAVKNFWEIEPLMSKGETREAAMAEFAEFVAAADAKGVSVMLDAAFNHTSWDVELGEPGVELFAPGAQPTDEIRHIETRFFSREGAYNERAQNQEEIAPAPDRFDFGKWLDVKDVFFGNYAALVPNADPANRDRFQNEEDWFDYTSDEPGYFDQITHDVWKYFGAYVPYWLEKTGHPAGTPPEQAHLGIDGLRCDFGQGLPPQAWEYMINRARSVKWNFVFMSETLDGGAPPYRSNRHFDMLNENILFALKDRTETSGFRGIFEERRNAFGYGLVLLNTTSHDEANYDNPWEALIRYALCSTQDGAPMIFAGQELGLTRLFGYEIMERNFGKFIPHFKTWNSMMPLWEAFNFDNEMLRESFSAIGRARHESVALRSHNRYFIDQLAGGAHQKIFSVAKYEEPLASPAAAEVVLGFVNLDRRAAQSGTFNVDIDLGEGNLFGIRPERLYNVRNLAALTHFETDRDRKWVWEEPRSGADILADGISVSLNSLPAAPDDWSNAPYEALFLKLYDVTALPAPTNQRHYVLASTATFVWNPVTDPSGTSVQYRVKTIVNDQAISTSVVDGTSLEMVANFGDRVRLIVEPFNEHMSGEFFESEIIHLLDPTADTDGDGLLNGQEDIAGTDPLDDGSVFTIDSVLAAPDGAGRHITVRTEPERLYTIFFADELAAEPDWKTFVNSVNGVGTWRENRTDPATYTFHDDEGPQTTEGPSATGTRLYHITVTAE